MIDSTTFILTVFLVALSFVAVVLLAIAAATVGLGSLLPFSGVPEAVRRRAAPYRRWFLIVLIAGFLISVLLAVIHVALPQPAQA